MAVEILRLGDVERRAVLALGVDGLACVYMLEVGGLQTGKMRTAQSLIPFSRIWLASDYI